jgi:hypothetical protein
LISASCQCLALIVFWKKRWKIKIINK